jgi:hypothetical protein
VKILHPARHGSILTLYLAIAVEETALERQARNLSLVIDGGANGEQTIRRPRATVSRRITTADNDFVWRAIHHFKVICQNCAGFIAGGSKLVSSPELRRRLRAVPFAVQKTSLYFVTCRLLASSTFNVTK